MYVETVLRVALTRFNVGSQCLSRVLHVTATLFRKSQPRVDLTSSHVQPNSISLAVFEILANGLRKEGRVTPSTIASMIEVSFVYRLFQSCLPTTPPHRQSCPWILTITLHRFERSRNPSRPKTGCFSCRITPGQKCNLKMTSLLLWPWQRWFFGWLNKSPTL